MSSFSNKLSKFLRGLTLLARRPALVNELLDREDEHQRQVIKRFGLAEGLPEVSFSRLTNEPVQLNTFAFLDGGSLPTDHALLMLLAQRINARSYFEIGTWRGESVINVAAVIPECHTLNLGADEMYRRGWSEDYIRLHGFFSQKNPSVTHLHGDSRSFDFSPYYGKQDLVFIDGDHHHDTIVSDTRTAFKLLRDEHSVIVWHDYAFSPESVRWNVLHAILEGTPADKRSGLVCISNTLCAAWLPFSLPTHTRRYPQIPEHAFSVQLNLYPC